MPGPEAAPRPTRIVRPPRGLPTLGLRELLARRDLVLHLALRDIRLRYSQTVLGVLWAVLQPLLQALVFSVALGRLVGVPADGAPYGVFVFAGLLPWQLCSAAISRATANVVTNRGLITRVAFPRLVIPASAALAALADLLVNTVLLLAYLAVTGLAPGRSLLLLPAAVTAALLASVGAAAWLSALNVRYRDVTHVVPFLLQLGTFASPIVYPLSLVPADWRTLYALNPLVVVVESFRASLLGTTSASPGELGTSLATLVALSFAGVVYFRLRERTLADEV